MQRWIFVFVVAAVFFSNNYGVLALVTTMTTRIEKTPRSVLSTRLNMVFSVPDSIVEQASSQDLIDQLLDECFRQSGRRPIMVQFHPSARSVRVECDMLISY